MGLRPNLGNENRRRYPPRKRRSVFGRVSDGFRLSRKKGVFRGEPQATKDLCGRLILQLPRYFSALRMAGWGRFFAG